VVTDRKPNTWFFGVKNPGSHLVRWHLLLKEYEYKIIFKPGTQNTNAGVLIRISITNSTQYPENSKDFEKYMQKNSKRINLNKNVKAVAGSTYGVCFRSLHFTRLSNESGYTT